MGLDSNPTSQMVEFGSFLTERQQCGHTTPLEGSPVAEMRS